MRYTWPEDNNANIASVMTRQNISGQMEAVIFPGHAPAPSMMNLPEALRNAGMEATLRSGVPGLKVSGFENPDMLFNCIEKAGFGHPANLKETVQAPVRQSVGMHTSAELAGAGAGKSSLER